MTHDVCPTPRGSQDTTSNVPWKYSVINLANIAMVWTPDPPGPPVRVGCRWKTTNGGGEWITWIEKDGPQLLPSRRQLDHREARIAGGAIMIIHRNLQVPAFQAGVRDVRAKALTTPPGNLRHTQKGRKSSKSRGKAHRRITTGCGGGGGDDATREQA